MRWFSSRDAWLSPPGLARVLLLLSGVWLIVAGLTGAPGEKVALPLMLLMLALGFMLGYGIGRSRQA